MFNLTVIIGIPEPLIFSLELLTYFIEHISKLVANVLLKLPILCTIRSFMSVSVGSLRKRSGAETTIVRS